MRRKPISCPFCKVQRWEGSCSDIEVAHLAFLDTVRLLRRMNMGNHFLRVDPGITRFIPPVNCLWAYEGLKKEDADLKWGESNHLLEIAAKYGRMKK